MKSAYKNSFLRSLDLNVIARLELQPVTFELRHEIEYPGVPVTHLYFIEEGMASQTVTFLDGDQVEVCMFGFESTIGISALMGTKRALNRVYTQIAGHGFASPIDCATREFQRSGRFHSLALRYVQAQLLQSMQSTACNAKHDIEQRLSRWLLLCADRAHSLSFLMPHEFLADMLGSTRPTVTTAAGLLRDRGLIEYTRGHIRILDSARLEQYSCECYKVIKDHLDNFAEFDSGMAVASMSA